MRPVNPMSIIPKYAKDSTYVDGPTQAQQEAGMIPLDTVPADWWNKLFQQLSEQVNNACNGMATAYNEILNVLSAANIQPDATQNDQLAQAINNLRQTVANATNAGAVKSSATSGKVSVGADGVMTPNGMGVPTTLDTVNKEIVSAINELKSAYDQAIQTINNSITSLGNDKAPNNHASSATTYGVGDSAKYGHLKISDTYASQVGGAAEGLAASQKALYDAYTALSQSALTIPIGVPFPFAGPENKVPAGYLLCQGQALLQAAYPALFAVIGTEYNLITDDPVTTFRLPDYSRIKFTPGSYSTTEQFTGRYWTDGKPIYCRTFSATNIPGGSASTVLGTIDNLDKAISLSGTYGDGVNMSPDYNSSTDWRSLPVIEASAVTWITGRYLNAIALAIAKVEYTKTTDDPAHPENFPKGNPQCWIMKY